jgi:hypothetical protein
MAPSRRDDDDDGDDDRLDIELLFDLNEDLLVLMDFFAMTSSCANQINYHFNYSRINFKPLLDYVNNNINF